jgi:choline kinase
MLGVVIAAGRGARMGALTDTRPKCMLEVSGRPLIDHSIARLRGAGCGRIVVVTGYQAPVLHAHLASETDVTCVRNPRAAQTNVLQSLITARPLLDGPCIVTYSDTIVSAAVYARLVATTGDIVLGVDVDWTPYYDGRVGHPVAEAEKVYLDASGAVHAVGKHLGARAPAALQVGEFVGLLRMSDDGCRSVVALIDELVATRRPDDRFQAADAWDRAYLTDLVQEALDRCLPVRAATVRRGWAEFDTPFDYHRFSAIAPQHGLSCS